MGDTETVEAPLVTVEDVRQEMCAIRKGAGLTLKAMGKALGVDANTIWRYEHGQSGIPLMALLLARTLTDRPREVLVSDKTPARLRRKRWEVAFVLFRVLPETTRCWHEKHPKEGEYDTMPCEGRRLQFVALLPPTPHVDRRRTETVTCEQHSYEALFYLQRQYKRWLGRIIGPAQRTWFERWVQTLRRVGDPLPPHKGG